LRILDSRRTASLNLVALNHLCYERLEIPLPLADQDQGISEGFIVSIKTSQESCSFNGLHFTPIQGINALRGVIRIPFSSASILESAKKNTQTDQSPTKMDITIAIGSCRSQ
jgi:hypothetical protein